MRGGGERNFSQFFIIVIVVIGELKVTHIGVIKLIFIDIITNFDLNGWRSFNLFGLFIGFHWFRFG